MGRPFRPFFSNGDFDRPIVMPGLVPGIHGFLDVATEQRRGWLSPAMTVREQ